jgi:hypothetical protein
MNVTHRVHLDHLIKRQSLRYAAPPAKTGEISLASTHRSDQNIRFDDIRQEYGWFSRIVKPDFQRATCAWTPEACVKFLNSILRRRIIPSIILWRSSETGFVYVLDGAHRLSVLRAWMADDWGDRAGDFYSKSENHREIIAAATAARAAVNENVGPFSEYIESHAEWEQIALAGGAPLQSMASNRAEKVRFYLDAFNSNRTLHAQWEDGDYAAAEESFLAINRQGEPLDDIESLLIEYRNSSLARVIMAIASAGATGHYWPEPHPTEPIAEPLREKLSQFTGRCAALHRELFVPPFDSSVRDINVPFIFAPGHFRLQQHLIELLPLLLEEAAIGREKLPEVLSKDHTGTVQDVILNADKLIGIIERKLKHIGGQGNGSLSLAMVPLIYWYNRKASFVRALMYAWMHWLLVGDENEVQQRKIVFSSVRGELEEALIRYKDEFAEIQHKAGAGLKSLAKLTTFIQELIQVLIESRAVNDEEREKRLTILFGVKQTAKLEKHGKSRSFTRTSRAEINVRTLLGSPARCEICGGVVDLKQGVQYDHKDEFSTGGLSIPENGRATHPFCNLFRERIAHMRIGKEQSILPKLRTELSVQKAFVQLDFFDPFPG